MDDSFLVEVLHCGEHLAHDVGCVKLSEALGRDDAVEKLATFAVLHDDVHIAVINEALVELDDVGVIN